VQSLDDASARLQKTLASLRNTPVEAAFRPAEEAPKHLFDFVDEGGIGHLESAIKASLDRFDAARVQLAETCQAFEQDLERLHVSMSPEEDADVHLQDGETPVPALFYQLETKATEAAGHLEGLVKHYDLCVTALKHTEGGGDAITNASIGEEQQTSALVGLGVDLDKMESAPAKPISDEERRELFHVLVKDADEVDEVVADIKDSLVEMEDSMTQITVYVDSLREAYGRLREAMVYLKEIVGRLPIYISACAEFQHSWDDEKNLLLEKLQELEGLTDFYAGFSDAYDELILEVQRRRQVRHSMEKIIKGALSELDALYQDDAARRDSFRDNQAEFIPSDLWPGLVNQPPKWRIVREEPEEGEVDDEMIEIGKSVVERSMKRVKERQKPFKRPA
jgi:autophagy-related protein 17